MSSIKEIYLPIADVNISNFVIEKPTKKFFKRKTIAITRSDVLYMDDDGKLRKIYVGLPERYFGGFFANHPMNEAKTDENVKGFQFSYSISEREDNDPEISEKIKAIMEKLRELIFEKGRETAELEEDIEDEEKSLSATFAAALTAKKANMEKLVKPTCRRYEYTDKNSGEKLLSESEVFDIKLNTFGTGLNKIKSMSPIFGPGDKVIHPAKLLFVKDAPEDARIRGRIEPVVSFSVFWGTHGTKSYIASLTVKLVEGNYIPFVKRDMGKRFLSYNQEIEGFMDVSEYKEPSKRDLIAQDSDSEEEKESDEVEEKEISPAPSPKKKVSIKLKNKQ